MSTKKHTLGCSSVVLNWHLHQGAVSCASPPMTHRGAPGGWHACSTGRPRCPAPPRAPCGSSQPRSRRCLVMRSKHSCAAVQAERPALLPLRTCPSAHTARAHVHARSALLQCGTRRSAHRLCHRSSGRLMLLARAPPSRNSVTSMTHSVWKHAPKNCRGWRQVAAVVHRTRTSRARNGYRGTRQPGNMQVCGFSFLTGDPAPLHRCTCGARDGVGVNSSALLLPGAPQPLPAPHRTRHLTTCCPHAHTHASLHTHIPTKPTHPTARLAPVCPPAYKNTPPFPTWTIRGSRHAFMISTSFRRLLTERCVSGCSTLTATAVPPSSIPRYTCDRGPGWRRRVQFGGWDAVA